MKKQISCILVVLMVALLFVGCKQKADLSKCPFVNITWTRSLETDTEYIIFNDNGDFSYYCACGNSVNDSDLCEGYSYYEDTKTIVLDYSEKTEDAVTEIIVEKCTDDKLVLDFNGDIRTFLVEKEKKETNELTYEDSQYVKIEFNKDIFNYTVTVGEEYETDKVYKISDSENNIVYYNNELYALKSEIDAVKEYYSNDENYTWSVLVADSENENLYSKDLTLTDSEIEYLYNMTNMEKNETISFEEIDKYAMFKKVSKDGLVSANIELVWRNDKWNWRSGITDEKTEGWPEFIFELPQSLQNKIGAKQQMPWFQAFLRFTIQGFYAIIKR